MRAALDRALSGLSRLMLRIFFRSIEVSVAERIPRGVPLLIVANHVNSIVDPMLLMAFVDGRSRTLAKSTLWSHPVVGPLLVLAGSLPVYRRRDAGQDPAKNLTTFARCHRELLRGGSVALFPEGTSHNLPHRLPLKTGAARIALETHAQNPSAGLRILPVGLEYEAKNRFRSRVLINVGKPIDLEPEGRAYATDGRAAVRALTERIADGLQAVTSNCESWDEARLLRLASAVGDDAPLSDRFIRSRAFLAAYRGLRAQTPESVAGVVQSLQRHDARLRELALVDEDFAASSRRAQSWRDLVLNLPLGAVGAILNLVPYRITDWVTHRFARTPDEPATYMLLTALLAFPASWLLVGAIAALVKGPLIGVLLTILAPITGYAALRVRGALQLLSRPRPPGDLEEQRAALAYEIRDLQCFFVISTDASAAASS